MVEKGTFLNHKKITVIKHALLYAKESYNFRLAFLFPDIKKKVKTLQSTVTAEEMQREGETLNNALKYLIDERILKSCELPYNKKILEPVYLSRFPKEREPSKWKRGIK